MHLVVESRIGSHHRVPRSERQGEAEAVVDRVVEVRGKPRAGMPRPSVGSFAI